MEQENENAITNLNKQKLELLLKIENLALKGAKFPKIYNSKSDYQEMLFDYNLVFEKFKAENIKKISDEITNISYNIKSDNYNFPISDFQKSFIMEANKYILEELNNVSIKLLLEELCKLNTNNETSNVKSNDGSNDESNNESNNESNMNIDIEI